MKPVPFIMAAFCFASIMMLFAIYERVVYFIGNCFEFNFVFFVVCLFFTAAMLGFVFEGMELDTTNHDRSGAP